MLETWLNSTLTLRVRSKTVVSKEKEIQSMAALLKLNYWVKGRDSLLSITQVETTSREWR